MKKTPFGTVYLIGCGPGDKGLLTLKGKECLQKAEVVIYDALVNPEILDWAKPGSKKIYVGKRGMDPCKKQRPHHKTDQRYINHLMVKQARQGNPVARLKGGDPFLLGRGGEEAEILARAKLPFEVIPGVSSVTAVPAYAGIPVTDRRYTSMLTVVTGHAAEDSYKGLTVDWNKISPKGTLVILMGVSRLPWIMQRLKKANWPASTPIACIRWGTTPQQQVVRGTIKDIVKKIQDAQPPFSAPAVIILGAVVQLSSKLHWFQGNQS
jgi:uroporphyrinogen III methyltransferase/synthase